MQVTSSVGLSSPSSHLLIGDEKGQRREVPLRLVAGSINRAEKASYDGQV